MADFVGDELRAEGAGADTQAMARGEPGLPAAFVWRGDRFAVTERLDAWKESSREGGRAGGDLYLRKHFYRLRMDDASTWTVYFHRQPGRGQRKCWVLYTREPG